MLLTAQGVREAEDRRAGAFDRLLGRRSRESREEEQPEALGALMGEVPECENLRGEPGDVLEAGGQIVGGGVRDEAPERGLVSRPFVEGRRSDAHMICDGPRGQAPSMMPPSTASCCPVTKLSVMRKR
jgi:hypothetical protein